MATVLTDTHALVDGCGLVASGGKDLDDQSRKGEKEPFNRHPPQPNAQPPQEAMLFFCLIRLRDDLRVHVVATTFWTGHFLSPFLYAPVVICFDKNMSTEKRNKNRNSFTGHDERQING